MGSEYQGQGWNRMSTRMFDDFHQQQLQQHHDIHNQFHNNMMNSLHNDSFMTSTNSPPSSNGISIKIGDYTFRLNSLVVFLVYYFIIFPMVAVSSIFLIFGILWLLIYEKSN
ncbi:unnamed protein product [Cunninghamella echinulata]